MQLLHTCYLFALAAMAWALWARRDTIGCRWDAPMTASVALYAVGIALDSPWGWSAAAAQPLLGKFYLLNTVAHILILLGAALGAHAISLRLLPDDAQRSFMRTRILAPVIGAAMVLLVCLVRSPRTSAMPAESLFLVRPDGWLIVYWLTFFGTLGGVNVVVVYGALRLRNPAQSVTHNQLTATLAVGVLACCGSFAVLVTGHTDLFRTLLWPAGLLAVGLGALATGISWRHRASQLRGHRTSGR